MNPHVPVISVKLQLRSTWGYLHWITFSESGQLPSQKLDRSILPVLELSISFWKLAKVCYVVLCASTGYGACGYFMPFFYGANFSHSNILQIAIWKTKCLAAVVNLT